MNYKGYIIYSSIFVVFILCTYFAIRVIKAINNHRINWFCEITRFLLIVYIAELVSVTLFPICIDIGNKPSILPITYEKRFYPIYVNLNPFNYNSFHSDSPYILIKNVFGNIFLMFPYTILLPFNFKIMRIWKMAIGTALLTSVSIELIQLVWQLTLLNMSRRTDITDVIQNLVGAVIGFVLYYFLFRKIPILKRFIINNSEENRELKVQPS